MLDLQKLNKLLQENNLSLYRLEKLTGISNQYLSNIWTGKMTNPSIEKAKKIADVFSLKIDDLLKK